MGYRKLPQIFITKLSSLETEQYIVSAVKHLDTEEEVLNLKIFQQLEDSYVIGEEVTVLPAWFAKSWVRWNQEGRLVTRKDLPKVPKILYWEAKNFGREDTHEVRVTREVWQKEILHGRSLEITAKATAVDGGGFRVMVDVNFPFDKSTSFESPDLLMATSLIQEAVASTPFPRPSKLSRAEWEESFQISWEFFSVTEFDTPHAIFEKFAHSRGISSTERKLMQDRVDMIQETAPSQIIFGTSGRTQYIGYKYKEDLVALENFFYGNALYVLYQNWSELSKKTRATLMNNHVGEVDRIVHSGKWKDRFTRILIAQGHELATK